MDKLIRDEVNVEITVDYILGTSKERYSISHNGKIYRSSEIRKFVIENVCSAGCKHYLKCNVTSWSESIRVNYRRDSKTFVLASCSGTVLVAGSVDVFVAMRKAILGEE